MKLDQVIQLMLPEIEKELKQAIDRGVPGEVSQLRSMLAYHLGWEGEGAGPVAQGKRIRPLLVLLSAASSGADWRKALPAAVSVELIHNFSLIHDDIQDVSEKRRGRPTVWVKWGIAQAINAGDLLFTLAFYNLHGLAGTKSFETVTEANRILQEACIHLTRGQYLDISYETRQEISLSEYWPMIGGKTGALLAASVELGALSAGASDERRQLFRKYGYSLGLAFQVWDDWLGVWGDPKVTGKSVASDLLAGKKTLPVIYALEKDTSFRDRWVKGAIQPGEIQAISQMMIESGAKEFTEKEAARLTGEAISALKQASQDCEGSQALEELTYKLISRKN